MSTSNAPGPRNSLQTSDLIGRYLKTLQSSRGGQSGVGLIDALKVDTLDWQFDHGLVRSDGSDRLAAALDAHRVR